MTLATVEALERGIPFLEGGWITVQQPMRDGHWTIRHPQTEEKMLTSHYALKTCLHTLTESCTAEGENDLVMPNLPDFRKVVIWF